MIKAAGLAAAMMAALPADSAIAGERQHTAPAAPSSSDPWVRIVSPTADGARETPRGARVLWAQRPTAARIQGLYPPRALRDGVSGGAELHCTVLTDLTASCAIVGEWPAGRGFGHAALSASALYRARPTLSDGTSAVGADVRVVVAFYAPPY
jgi:hypothetical protein